MNFLFCIAVFLHLPADEPATELEWCRHIKTHHLPAAGIESPLWERSRIDLLTETEAIEVDWAKKWPEGIGQAIFYSKMTGKKPVVLLLSKDLVADQRFLFRAKLAADGLVAVWIYDIKNKKLIR